MLKEMLLLAAFSIPSEAPDTTVIQKTGYARDAESGELVYLEHHAQFVRDGSTVGHYVRYEGPDGTLLATKQLDYRSDPLVPDFLMEDRRTGYLEGVVRTENGPRVFCRKGADAAFRHDLIEGVHDALADAGFDRLIETRWDELLAGDTITRAFVVPVRLGTVDFRIRVEEQFEENGVPLVAFTMAPKNGMLRLFVEPIRVVYDAVDHGLVRYRGISNVRDENLENFDVVIDFPIDARVVRVSNRLPPLDLQLPTAASPVVLTSAQ